MKIKVDGKVYPTKKKALEFFRSAMYACDGSEQERMTFAYFSILDGCNYIDTYLELSVRLKDGETYEPTRVIRFYH